MLYLNMKLAVHFYQVLHILNISKANILQLLLCRPILFLLFNIRYIDIPDMSLIGVGYSKSCVSSSLCLNAE